MTQLLFVPNCKQSKGQIYQAHTKRLSSVDYPNPTPNKHPSNQFQANEK